MHGSVPLDDLNRTPIFTTMENFTEIAMIILYYDIIIMVIRLTYRRL